MTIAVGILATDGVVLAADTQETSTIKGFALKIRNAMTQMDIHSNVQSAIAITGSGPSGIYLDAIADEIIKNFHANQRTRPTELLSDLEQYLVDFYGTHVVPLLPHIDKDFNLIIGAQIEGQSALWVSDATKLRQVRGFDVIGTGSPYATMAIGTRTFNPDVRIAILLAIRAVMEAKEHDLYCGKSTQVICLMDNLAYGVPWYQIKKAEELFGRYSGTEGSSFQYALGRQSGDEDSRTAKVASWLEEMRREFRQLASEMLKDPP